MSHLQQVMRILQLEKLYIDLKKFNFMTLTTMFLGFVVLSKGLEVDPNNVKTILEWPVPRILQELCTKFSWVVYILSMLHKKF